MTPNLFEISLGLVLFLFLSFLYRKINKAIVFSITTLPLLVLSISIVSVIYYNRLGHIEIDIYYIILTELFIYFIFIAIAPFFILKKYTNLSNYMNIRKFDLQIAKIIFYISLIIGLIYIGILWGTYNSGADRFILNKKLRYLMLLNTLFSIWALALSSVIYAKTKDKIFLFYVIIIIILSIFMGSRSAAVGGLLLFLFFYLQVNIINNRIFTYIAILALLLLLLPTLIMYEDGLNMLINRIFMSADIYLWSFVIGDYRELIDYYEPLMYLLHPFTSLIGIRGYDFPMGAQILATANLEPTGTGPQDQMAMLGLIFFNDCVPCILLFTLFFGLLSMLSLIFIFYFFSLTKISLSLRVLIFILLYTKSISIFIGVNAYSFNIIIAILGLGIYFLFHFLKDISKKRKLFNHER